ncbi:MAG TPA: hypothetical protein DCX28_03220, partial [Enterobacteriaceae bacterium]|nr:hypothetical protein [Enterobacteriaceae bacterium]
MNIPSTELTQQLRSELAAVETLYRAFSEQNPDLVDTVLAPEWDDIPLAPGQAPGPAGIKTIINMVVAAFPDVHITIHDTIQEPGKVGVRAEIGGTHLGELFGVVRQSAGDIAGQWQDSLLNAQYPERLTQLRSLAESRALPSADDLDAFWMTLLEDLAASGRVERVQLPVVGTDGARSEQPVLRVGSFSTFTDEAFLRYDADAGELLVPPRQPSGKGLIEDYLKSSDALATLPVDPSRGTLLAQLQRQPDLWDRVKQGGLVGGVILVLDAVGLLLAIWRMV